MKRVAQNWRSALGLVSCRGETVGGEVVFFLIMGALGLVALVILYVFVVLAFGGI